MLSKEYLALRIATFLAALLAYPLLSLLNLGQTSPLALAAAVMVVYTLGRWVDQVPADSPNPEKTNGNLENVAFFSTVMLLGLSVAATPALFEHFGTPAQWRFFEQAQTAELALWVFGVGGIVTQLLFWGGLLLAPKPVVESFDHG
ncbi:MAG TPA: hypothetical protein VHP58_03075 [Alphaproteobacteria bacterium]|nr:hypothetical protein [Alphaproteobacteria bacterium]